MHSHCRLRNGDRTSDQLWRVACPVLVAVILTMTGSIAYAQIQLPRQGGIPMGKFLFFPSTMVEFGHSSNVLRTSVDVPSIPSGLLLARLNLKMDMPLGAHHIRWSYSPQYTDYATTQFVSDDYMSHYFNFESRFQLGRSFSIELNDRIVRGVTEVQEFDPGGERVFGLSPFRLHEPQLNMEFRFGARQRLVMSPRYTRASFDDAEAAVRFSYDTEAIEARYGFLVSAPTELFAFLTREDTKQKRRTLDFEDSRLLTEAAGIGFSRSVNDNVITTFSTAYTRVDVEGGTGGSDFSGMSFEAAGNWRLTDQMQISVTGQRRPFQSFFLNNVFYVSNLLSIQLIHQIGSRTFWQAVARYQINNYPEALVIPPDDPNDPGDDTGDTWLNSAGVRRRDNLGEVEIGVSYRLSSSMRMFLGYNYLQRKSNIRECRDEPSDLGNNGVCDAELIAPFSFNEDRIVVRLEAGWL